MTTLDLIAAALREDGYVARLDPIEDRLYAKLAAGKFGVWIVHPTQRTFSGNGLYDQTQVRVMDAHPYGYEKELAVLEVADPDFFSKLEDVIWKNRR